MLILAYHRVNPGAKDGLSVTPAMLEAQLAHLRERGWQNVTLEESIASGTLSTKGTRFAITFDDGYQDNYFYAWPLLERLGMRATVFVSTHYADTGQTFPWVMRAAQGAPLQREDLPLTWDQIKEMMRSGSFTFGSHTVTHPLLSTLDRDSAYREIRDSKQALEDNLGVPVDTFCYPAGDFKRETVQIVSRSGYVAAVVTPNRFIPENPLALHRIGVYRNTTLSRFRIKTSPLFTLAQKSRLGWWARGLVSRALAGAGASGPGAYQAIPTDSRP